MTQEFENLDDLFRQMKLDELEDATLLTPVAYARSRGIYPQRVYQALRNRKLETTYCPCGRKCIDPKAADEVFGIGSSQQKGLSKKEALARVLMDSEE